MPQEGWLVGRRQSGARHWAFHGENLFADHAWSQGVENGERVACRVEPPEQAPLGFPAAGRISLRVWPEPRHSGFPCYHQHATPYPQWQPKPLMVEK